MKRLKEKYNCPVCGNVPKIRFEGATNYIMCCEMFAGGHYVLTTIRNWKNICRLVESIAIKGE